jgi:hypothetical protein
MAQRQSLPVRRKTLTPFTTSTAHQLRVLEMQFDLALEFGVNVSLHSVRAQGKPTSRDTSVLELQLKWNPIRGNDQVLARFQEEARREI